MKVREEIRLLRHGRDWRGRSTVPRTADPWVLEEEEQEFPTAWPALVLPSWCAAACSAGC